LYRTNITEGARALDAVSCRPLWIPIDDTQNPNWQTVGTVQNPNWTPVPTTQSPNWTEINT
jgi:hypothetical protein